MAFDPDVAEDCRNYILEQIKNKLPLREMRVPSSDIQIRKFPWDLDRLIPGITVHPETESFGESGCSWDDVGYGVAITWVFATDFGGATGLKIVDKFRAYIRGLFNNQRIPVSNVFICTVEHGDWIVPKQFRKHNNYSAMLVRCWSEDERI